MADGCEIGNSGYSFVLEAFYNPDGIRRFGTELFGDDVFGDGTTVASAPRWVDVTPYAHSVVIERGHTDDEHTDRHDHVDMARLPRRLGRMGTARIVLVSGSRHTGTGRNPADRRPRNIRADRHVPNLPAARHPRHPRPRN